MIDKTLHEYINQISKLSDEDLALLLSCVTKQQLKKGELLLNEGEVCRSFYLVKKGYLRTYYNKNGTTINLNFTFEGGFTSNLKSFKSKQPSEVIIKAGEPASVWIFQTDLISQQFRQHTQLSNFIRRLAIRLLLASEEHSSLFKMYTPAERYHYIEKNRAQLLQRISLSQLASYLGVTRETLSRIRAKKVKAV